MKITNIFIQHQILFAHLIFCFIGGSIQAQTKASLDKIVVASFTGGSECGTQERHNYLMETDPKYREHFEQLEARMTSVNKHFMPDPLEKRTQYTIPVVVHVIHLGEPIGTGSNISDAQIEDALRGINERFSNTIGDGLDIGIQFCLASKDPNGNPTTGINRVNGSSVSGFVSYGISWNNNCGANEQALKDLSRWPVLDYYNIWIVHEICGTPVGYAYYPWGGEYDGAVLEDNVFNYGAHTPSHELGHAFFLYHTFEGDQDDISCPQNIDCTVDGDKVCDTPPHKKRDCGSINPCPGGGNWDNSRLNYMSYCSTQRSRFTSDQKDRMLNALNEWPRNELLNSPAGCQSQGCSYPNTVNVDLDWTSYNSYTYSGSIGSVNSFGYHVWYDDFNGTHYTCGNDGTSTPEIIYHVTVPYNSLDWNYNQVQFSVFSDDEIKVYIYDGDICQVLNAINSDKPFQSGAILEEGHTYDIVVEGKQGAQLKVVIAPKEVYFAGICTLDGIPINCEQPIEGHTSLSNTPIDMVYYTKNENRSSCSGEFVSHSNYFSTEQKYVFTAPTPGDYEFTLTNLSGSSYDPDFFLFTCYDTSMVSINPWDLPDKIKLYMNTGDEIQLVVDGWNNRHTGDFSITIVGPDCTNCQAQVEAIAIHTTCGKNNGIIVANTSGGNGFSYNWSPNANTGDFNTAENLPPGDYSVTVTSIEGCTAVAYATVYGSSNISTTYSVIHESCKNCNNGEITIMPSGGNSYQYSWSPNANTGNSPTAKNLAPGTYSVTVTSQSCSTSLSIKINAFDCLAINTEIDKKDESCLDKCNGSATINATGGTPPFTYKWSNGESNASIDNLCAGIYTVTVTDHGKCTDKQSIQILKGGEVTSLISIIGTVLKVVVDGGTQPYQYLWNTGETTSLITPLSNGNYTVIVTDALGCKDTAEIVYSGMATGSPLSNGWKIYPNPVQDKLYVEHLQIFHFNEMKIFDLNGNVLSVLKENNGQNYSIDVSSLVSGVYILRISNEYGSLNFRFVKISR